jgi:peroxiredoxin (alkyl hydroperoxide reductase subunit C)
MTVRVGTPAPVVPVPAYVPGEVEPRVLSLALYRGEWVVLVFYPRDFTFVCPTELRALAELDDDFTAAGAQVVAASTDSYWSHRAWFGSEPALQGVSYPVLADTAHALGDAYGVLDADGAALRATFVIDPAGVIRHASVSDQAVGRSPAETLRVLHALQTGELCPVDWRPGTPTLQLAA